MKYIADNDLHIHSVLSSCANDTEQTSENILDYAVGNNIHTICLTNHFWDETVNGASEWYRPQDFAHISTALPLPQNDGIRFLFGCETELNASHTLGISKERMDMMDFIIIPTTHFHMKGYTLHPDDMESPISRANAWVRRFEAVLNMDLPFQKVGIAHLTCRLIAPGREVYAETLASINTDSMYRLFKRAAALGVGIEINADDMNYKPDMAEFVLKPYRIAKECGCRFYLGSDAHCLSNLQRAPAIFQKAIDALELTEADKFII